MEENKLLNALKEASKDETYMNRLINASSKEEFEKILSEREIEATLEEVEACYKAVSTTQDDEIKEEDLDEVTGGFCFTAAVGCAACVAFLVGYAHGRRCK